MSKTSRKEKREQGKVLNMPRAGGSVVDWKDDNRFGVNEKMASVNVEPKQDFSLKIPPSHSSLFFYSLHWKKALLNVPDFSFCAHKWIDIASVFIRTWH